jgi:rare lipoprotein A
MKALKAPRPARLRQAIRIATMMAFGALVTSSGMAQTAQFAAAFADMPQPIPATAPQPHAVDVTEVIAEPAIAESPAANLGTGVASYYADQFNGRRTASGERFDNRAYTAAHRTLPFGTRVRVTNPANGASVVVRINDRGPFTRGRTIDLSRVAAEDLGLVQRGHGTVQLEQL